MSEDPRAREHAVIDTFVALAETLASDYDIGDLLHLLVERCGEVLRAGTAGVVIETADGDLRLAAALSEEMDAIEQAELSAGEGPCIEAYRTRAPVFVPDLAEHRDRWPDVVPKLLDLGMASGHAFPLVLRDDCIGALNVYRREPGGFDEDDVRLAQTFADVAALGIVQQRTVAAAEERAEQLQRALDSRVVIEQAKGIIAHRRGITAQEAFERLRSHARSNQLKIHDVARRVVDEVADVTAPD